MEEEQSPWLPGSGFDVLVHEIQTWKHSLPSWLDFSADNVYIRRESHQLGALLLIHCMYHHVMCDVHRIALPDLYKNQEPFVFPATAQAFVGHLQETCFEHAQRMSVLVSTILQHGVKHFADSILPSFVYNSSRIMLYYIARLLDISKPGASTLIGRTLELVQQNNNALREMILMYPLAESLCATTERWLETVRASLARGDITTYIAPQDPSENEARRVVGAPVTGTTDLRHVPETSALSVLPSIADRLRAVSPDTSQLSPIGYDAIAVTPSHQALATVLAPPLSNPTASQSEVFQGPMYNTASPLEQHPMFDLDELQNFFEWTASGGENAQSTGFEGFGPLGWANNFSIM